MGYVILVKALRSFHEKKLFSWIKNTISFLASVVWKEFKSNFFDFDFGFVENLGIVNELGACVREGLH